MHNFLCVRARRLSASYPLSSSNRLFPLSFFFSYTEHNRDSFQASFPFFFLLSIRSHNYEINRSKRGSRSRIKDEKEKNYFEPGIDINGIATVEKSGIKIKTLSRYKGGGKTRKRRYANFSLRRWRRVFSPLDGSPIREIPS